MIPRAYADKSLSWRSRLRYRRIETIAQATHIPDRQVDLGVADRALAQAADGRAQGSARQVAPGFSQPMYKLYRLRSGQAS